MAPELQATEASRRARVLLDRRQLGGDEHQLDTTDELRIRINQQAEAGSLFLVDEQDPGVMIIKLSIGLELDPRRLVQQSGPDRHSRAVSRSRKGDGPWVR